MPPTFDHAADRSDMRASLLAWPDQVRRGWEQGRQAAGETGDGSPRAALWAGMGGSAIGGDYLAALLAPAADFPLIVHRGGPLPAWTGEDDLVVLVSYSGNTAETLAAAREAMSRGSRLCTLSAGGKLTDLAGQQGIEAWPVTGGFMPRAMLGEMAMTALGAFHEHGWYRTDPAVLAETLRRLDELTDRLAEEPGDSNHPLHELLVRLQDRHPMIYGTGCLAPVARRWATQLNENAKRAAQWGVLPEMNHNEVVAWTEDNPRGDRYETIFLADPAAPEDVRMRIPVSEELARRAGWGARTLHAEAEHRLTRMLEMTVLGDWLSYWLALAAGVDPTPIPTIDALKARLTG